MDKMEAVEVGESSRPKKCPRRELAETKDTNETTKISVETKDSNVISSCEETTKIETDDTNEITKTATEALIASLVAEESDLPALTQLDAPAPTEAPAPDANFELPSASSAKPRRRSRKGVPKRAPSR